MSEVELKKIKEKLKEEGISENVQKIFLDLLNKVNTNVKEENEDVKEENEDIKEENTKEQEDIKNIEKEIKAVMQNTKANAEQKETPDIEIDMNDFIDRKKKIGLMAKINKFRNVNEERENGVWDFVIGFEEDEPRKKNDEEILNSKLHMIANIKTNDYSVLDSDGKKIISIVINGMEDGRFKESLSQEVIDKRRKKIINEYEFVTEKNVEKIDTATYKVLKELDKKYSTNYSEKYVKLMTIDPIREKTENKQKYENRFRSSKRTSLEKMNMDFTYNTKGLLTLKGVKLSDKIKYLRNIKTQQKYTEANVYSGFMGLFGNKNKLLAPAKNMEIKEKVKEKAKTIFGVSKKTFSKMTFKSFHMPKLNIKLDKQKAKRYFGRTVMAGVAALSLFGAAFSKKPVEQEKQPQEHKQMEYMINKENAQKEENTFQKAKAKFYDELQVSQKIQPKQENVESKEQVTQQEEVKEQNPVMAQIKNLVDNTLNISGGSFYSLPDGTGSFGNFSEHNGNIKVDLVNLFDENGQKLCTVSAEELKTLPEDISAQVKSFQCHVSNETTDLGWNTDKQLEEMNANGSIKVVEEKDKDKGFEIG